MGAAWGLIRWISGSVIVASVSHGVWNGFTYALFGFGTRAGASGHSQSENRDRRRNPHPG